MDVKSNLDLYQDEHIRDLSERHFDNLPSATQNIIVMIKDVRAILAKNNLQHNSVSLYDLEEILLANGFNAKSSRSCINALSSHFHEFNVVSFSELEILEKKFIAQYYLSIFKTTEFT